ncbi:asparagine synthase-related protein [Kitasatospora sp. NPDC096147]|uniref:asparagine synthase-related protein n=1 Tax=Kitasatospora sp. NPDC096147 TaxID=3364093 RepID=UPI0038073B9E
MRWLTGWCGSSPGAGPGEVRPIAATVLWHGVSPLWAVGDWRPDEIRLVTLRPGAPAVVTTGPPSADTDPASAPAAAEPPGTVRLAVLGRCGASDAELAAGLATARGGAVRHLTTWPGSYTAVLRTGPRSTVLLTDLAGVLPVFHTPYEGGTAYATAALPLADLVGAPLDTGHLAARLACPESPEALGESTPYLGVRRVPPGHLLGIRNGRAHVTGYEPEQSGAPTPREEAPAVRELTRALLESVRCRVRASRPGAGRPRLGADLSYGTGSATVALLAAAVPIAPAPAAPVPPVAPAESPQPAPRSGAVKGSWARPADRADSAPSAPATPERLTAVTLPEEGPPGTELELPPLRQLLVPSPLPYAELAGLAGPEGPGAVPPGPLTDEPGTALVAAARLGHRFEAGGADHLTGYGARQVLDGHPARLADLVRAGRARRLAGPVTALAGAERAAATSAFGTVRTPLTVWRAAHRLARARYAEALDDAAVRLTVRHRTGGGSPGDRSVAELAWCVPGPAARWLSDDALSAVALRLRLAARAPAPAEPPGARRARQALHRHAAEYRTLLHAAEQQGQRLHAPFLDNQVVRAARLLPDETRLQPGARHALLRAVLAGATRTDLPPGWGPRPGRDAADRAGLHRAADGLAELFRAPLLAEAGLIDLPAVRTALATLRSTDPSPDTVAGLAELVSTELWLRRIHARRHGTSWTGLPTPPRQALARPA